MKEDKDIEQLFRSSFEEFEVTPPPGVKEAIARRIASPWYRRPFFLLIFAGLIVAGSSLLLFLETDKHASVKPNLAADHSSQSTVNSGSSEHSSSVKTSEHKTPSQKNNLPANSRTTVGGGSEKLTQDNTGSPPRRKANNQITRSGKAGTTIATNQSKSSGTGSGKPKAAPKVKTKTSKGNRSKKDGNTSGKKGGYRGYTPDLTADGKTLSKQNAGKNIPESDPKLPIDPDAEKNLREKEVTEKAIAQQLLQKQQDSLAELEFVKIIQAKQDSIAKANEASAANDSVPPAKNSVSPADQKARDKKDNSYNWQASFYGAILPVINTGTTDGAFGVESAAMRSVSAELQRKFLGQWAVSTGFNYAKRTEIFSQTNSETSTYYVGTDSVPIMQGDTIVGYEYYENYDTTVYSLTYHHNKVTQSFGIPLFVGRSFTFGKTWGADLQLGGIVQFYKVSSSGDVESTEPAYTKTGFQGFVRLNATYTWNRFAFSAGLNGGYDFKPSVIYSDFRRKVVYLGPQIGLHYRF